MRVLGISGSLSTGSRTSRIITQVLAAAKGAGADTEVLEISQHALVFCDGRQPDLYEGITRKVIEKVVTADAYVVGSPMYRGSYTGALKNLFDLLPNEALRGKAVGLVATGGSDHHFLALEHQLRPLMSFFQAYTVPGAVYAQNADFGGERIAEKVAQQCGELGAEVVRLARLLQAGVAPGARVEDSAGTAGPRYPAIERKPGQRP